MENSHRKGVKGLGPKAFTRNHKLNVNFTPGEVADLKMVAEAWGCTMSGAIWALTTTALAKMRGRKALDLPYDEVSLRLLELRQKELTSDGRSPEENGTDQERAGEADPAGPGVE